MKVLVIVLGVVLYCLVTETTGYRYTERQAKRVALQAESKAQRVARKAREIELEMESTKKFEAQRVARQAESEARRVARETREIELEMKSTRTFEAQRVARQAESESESDGDSQETEPAGVSWA